MKKFIRLIMLIAGISMSVACSSNHSGNNSSDSGSADTGDSANLHMGTDTAGSMVDTSSALH